MALAWCSLVLSLLGAGAALVCPDGTACHDGSTCCEDVLGRYGCCPLPNAVCCSDGLRCCPHGTVCDLQHATCANTTASLPWTRSLPPERSGRGSAVMCPDRHSECPDATTCCQLPDGSWGCCPLAKAVCCDDKRHCCPEGTACDLSRSICASAGRDWRGWRPLVEKLPAGPGLGAPATCPDETTCCQVSSGAYGCCPVPDVRLFSKYFPFERGPSPSGHVLLGPPPLLPSRHRVQLGRRHVRRGRGRTPRPGDPRRPAARRGGRRDDGERTRRADRPPAAAGSVLRGRLPPPPRRAHVPPPPLVPLPRTPRDPLARQSARRHAPGGRRRRQVRRQEQLRGGHYLLQAAHRGVGVLPARQGCVLR
ncbi:granulin b isoform X3 [Phyllopteryx taeniolatus]|uniref:granulin b isoform X3 n=1 Tax=Phyllopteryx taeniolatus TaxID=161469 RepID=UPI002AD2DC4B|nr:granulin b isoform X3 [Phyllopteryx taeniolatus]